MNEKEIAYREGYAKGYQDAKKEERHGRWIWDTEDIYECNHCGEKSHVKEVMGMPAWDYCPNCGAIMDLPNITEQTENALRKLGEQTHGDN